MKTSVLIAVLLALLASSNIYAQINKGEEVITLTCEGEDTLVLPSGRRQISKISPDLTIRKNGESYLLSVRGTQLAMTIVVINIENSQFKIRSNIDENSIEIENISPEHSRLVSIDRRSGNLFFRSRLEVQDGLTVLFGNAKCRKSEGRLF